MKRKLSFYHHLLNLKDNTLAKAMVRQQCKFHYPGHISECKVLLDSLGLANVSPLQFSKERWKRTIKNKIYEKNKKQLLDSMRGYKKIKANELKLEEFKVKDYLKEFNVANARTRFSLRSCQTRTVKFNQLNNREFAAVNYQCIHCEYEGRELSIDSIPHIVTCLSYSEFRAGRYLSRDLNLVDYINDVIHSRDELENSTKIKIS